MLTDLVAETWRDYLFQEPHQLLEMIALYSKVDFLDQPNVRQISRLALPRSLMMFFILLSCTDSDHNISTPELK